MKKITILGLYIFLYLNIQAQNVGIGTAIPANKLQVHNSIGTDNFIRITNSATGTTSADGLVFGGIGANASLMNLENGSLNLGTNNGVVVSINNTGKVGIGNNTALAKLQVNSLANVILPTVMLVDSSLTNGGVLKFKNLANTTGISFSEFSENSFNNGQYLDVQSDSAVIATFQGDGRVGIRNLSPSYPLDVNGDINTTGLLRLNGNAGNIGQMLTSNGTSAPTWADVPYANNIRFSFQLNSFGANTQSQDSLNLNYATPNYNLNTAMVSTVPGNITRILFNKTGLYHFEGSMYLEANTSTAINFQPIVFTYFYINNRQYFLEANAINNQAALPTTQFQRAVKFNFDIHISAGQTLKLSRFFSGLSGTFFTLGNFQGYLISE